MKREFGTIGQMILFCLLEGLPKGEDPDLALAHGNVSIARGHGHAPETARGSRHGLTRVKDVPEKERRRGRRKDYLPYDPRL